jgi:hypothetical protein
MRTDNISLFELIVRTLQSPQYTDPQIIRHHIEQYAKQNYISYELAKQAIIETVRIRIDNKLEAL